MFTGEAGMIAGQRTVVQARVIQAGEILELRPAEIRALVSRDAGLGEILLRAFVLRRLMLINRQLGNVALIGSRHSADTLRLQEFLGRNGHPYTYVDLDSDETSRNLLERFSIAVSEIPIVIGNGTMVLRNPSTSHLAVASDSTTTSTRVCSTISLSSAPGRRVWQRRHMGHPKDWILSLSKATHPAGRPAPVRRSKII
jgi:hypothetical protein